MGSPNTVLDSKGREHVNYARPTCAVCSAWQFSCETCATGKTTPPDDHVARTFATDSLSRGSVLPSQFLLRTKRTAA
jgi:hypothetical protein